MTQENCGPWRRPYNRGLREDPITEGPKENPINEKPREGPITVKPKENATINISSGASGLSTTFAPQKNSF